jgi:type II secretory pathway pseudopilin PulG
MSRSGRQGVAWIEALIVLLIIGIIVVILRPRFTKDPTVEARRWLGQIYTSEQGYRQRHGTYTADFGALDLKVPPESKYTYKITSADSVSFTAEAFCEDLEGDGVADVWTIDQTEQLVHRTAD